MIIQEQSKCLSIVQEEHTVLASSDQMFSNQQNYQQQTANLFYQYNQSYINCLSKGMIAEIGTEHLQNAYKSLQQNGIFTNNNKTGEVRYNIEERSFDRSFLTVTIELSHFKMNLTIINVDYPLISEKQQIFFKGVDKKQDNSSGRFIRFVQSHGKIYTVKYHQRNQYDIQQVLKELAFLKVFSALGVGAHYQPLFGFDLICGKDYYAFSMEKCQQLSQSIPIRISQNETEQQILGNSERLFSDLTKDLILVHKLNIVHLDIKTQNIMYSHHFKKLIFIDFGNTFSIKQKNTESTLIFAPVGTVGYFGSQMKRYYFSSYPQKAYINLYLNDVQALQICTQSFFKKLKNLLMRKITKSFFSWQQQQSQTIFKQDNLFVTTRIIHAIFQSVHLQKLNLQLKKLQKPFYKQKNIVSMIEKVKIICLKNNQNSLRTDRIFYMLSILQSFDFSSDLWKKTIHQFQTSLETQNQAFSINKMNYIVKSSCQKRPTQDIISIQTIRCEPEPQLQVQTQNEVEQSEEQNEDKAQSDNKSEKSIKTVTQQQQVPQPQIDVKKKDSKISWQKFCKYYLHQNVRTLLQVQKIKQDMKFEQILRILSDLQAASKIWENKPFQYIKLLLDVVSFRSRSKQIKLSQVLKVCSIFKETFCESFIRESLKNKNKKQTKITHNGKRSSLRTSKYFQKSRNLQQKFQTEQMEQEISLLIKQMKTELNFIYTKNKFIDTIFNTFELILIYLIVKRPNQQSLKEVEQIQQYWPLQISRIWKNIVNFGFYNPSVTLKLIKMVIKKYNYRSGFTIFAFLIQMKQAHLLQTFSIFHNQASSDYNRNDQALLKQQQCILLNILNSQLELTQSEQDIISLYVSNCQLLLWLKQQNQKKISQNQQKIQSLYENIENIYSQYLNNQHMFFYRILISCVFYQNLKCLKHKEKYYNFTQKGNSSEKIKILFYELNRFVKFNAQLDCEKKEFEICQIPFWEISKSYIRNHKKRTFKNIFVAQKSFFYAQEVQNFCMVSQMLIFSFNNLDYTLNSIISKRTYFKNKDLVERNPEQDQTGLKQNTQDQICQTNDGLKRQKILIFLEYVQRSLNFIESKASIDNPSGQICFYLNQCVDIIQKMQTTLHIYEYFLKQPEYKTNSQKQCEESYPGIALKTLSLNKQQQNIWNLMRITQNRINNLVQAKLQFLLKKQNYQQFSDNAGLFLKLFLRFAQVQSKKLKITLKRMLSIDLFYKDSAVGFLKQKLHMLSLVEKYVKEVNPTQQIKYCSKMKNMIMICININYIELKVGCQARFEELNKNMKHLINTLTSENQNKKILHKLNSRITASKQKIMLSKDNLKSLDYLIYLKQQQYNYCNKVQQWNTKSSEFVFPLKPLEFLTIKTLYSKFQQNSSDNDCNQQLFDIYAQFPQIFLCTVFNLVRIQFKQVDLSQKLNRTTKEWNAFFSKLYKFILLFMDSYSSSTQGEQQKSQNFSKYMQFIFSYLSQLKFIKDGILCIGALVPYVRMQHHLFNTKVHIWLAQNTSKHSKRLPSIYPMYQLSLTYSLIKDCANQEFRLKSELKEYYDLILKSFLSIEQIFTIESRRIHYDAPCLIGLRFGVRCQLIKCLLIFKVLRHYQDHYEQTMYQNQIRQNIVSCSADIFGILIQYIANSFQVRSIKSSIFKNQGIKGYQGNKSSKDQKAPNQIRFQTQRVYDNIILAWKRLKFINSCQLTPTINHNEQLNKLISDKMLEKFQKKIENLYYK